MPATPTSSASVDVTSSPSSHGISVGLEIGLVVLGVLAVLGAIFLAVFLRCKRSSGDERKPTNRSSKAGASLSGSGRPSYASPGHPPRYKHVPGTHMRIAHRDWDGSWKLLDPDTPFRPSGVSEVSPSPSSSTFRFGDIPLSVESFSVTRGYDGYDYDVKDPPQGAPDFGDQVLDISHGGLQK